MKNYLFNWYMQIHIEINRLGQNLDLARVDLIIGEFILDAVRLVEFFQ